VVKKRTVPIPAGNRTPVLQFSHKTDEDAPVSAAETATYLKHKPLQGLTCETKD